ncbi:MAG: hypothetical protein E6Q88_09970, partial [Lysobacteraceae bacterium]
MSLKLEPVSESAVATALQRLHDLQLLSADDLRRLRAMAARLDRESRRFSIDAPFLAELFPDVVDLNRDNALAKLVHRLKQAQDVACNAQKLGVEQRIELKVERKKEDMRARDAWFLGRPAQTEYGRITDLLNIMPRAASVATSGGAYIAGNLVINQGSFIGRDAIDTGVIRNFAIDLSPTDDTGAASDQAPILILTVNPRETAALHDVFMPGGTPEVIERDKYPYTVLGEARIEAGKPRRRVLGFRCQMGSADPGASIQRVAKAIAHFKPEVVLAVGIGFGDHEKQQLGDVMISREVTTYEHARMNSDGSIEPRGRRLDAPDVWLERSSAIPPAGIVTRTGLVICGEKLVDSADFRGMLKAQYPKAIGGDMESYGLA